MKFLMTCTHFHSTLYKILIVHWLLELEIFISDGLQLHSIVLYCIVLYCIVLYCIIVYCILLYCTLLYCIALNCIILYCIILYGIELSCIALYYIVLKSHISFLYYPLVIWFMLFYWQNYLWISNQIKIFWFSRKRIIALWC